MFQSIHKSTLIGNQWSQFIFISHDKKFPLISGRLSIENVELLDVINFMIVQFHDGEAYW